MSYRYGPIETTWRGQRNNAVSPAATCGPTMMVMVLGGAGAKLPPTDGRQPEDALARFAMADARVKEYMRKEHPTAFAEGWPIYSEPSTLAFAANLWVGRTVVAFTYRYSLEEIVRDLARGRPVGLIGMFTTKGHYVACVGVETAQHLTPETRPVDVDLGIVQRFSIHDPYGDYHTHYADPDGSACAYSASELRHILCDADAPTKWAFRVMA